VIIIITKKSIDQIQIQNQMNREKLLKLKKLFDYLSTRVSCTSFHVRSQPQIVNPTYVLSCLSLIKHTNLDTLRKFDTIYKF